MTTMPPTDSDEAGAILMARIDEGIAAFLEDLADGLYEGLPKILWPIHERLYDLERRLTTLEET